MSIILGLLIGLLLPVVFVVSLIYFIKGGHNDSKSLTTKEFFLEIAIFSSLVSSIVSFVYILFLAIDKRFEDVLNVNNYGYNDNSDLASMASVLLVVFPLYLIFAWTKANNFKKSPSRKDVKAFEYGIYLTMFSTILFFVGSLIAVIYNFLMGELSVVFGLKLCVVLLVSLSLFGYSYFSLRRDFTKKTILPKVFTLSSVLVVIAGLAYAISVLGSPMEMRKRKFDDLRLSNLSEIQNQVLNFWQKEYKLPENLSSIKTDGMGNFNLSIKDPKSKVEYGYAVIENSTSTKATAEACRNFFPSRFTNVTDTATIKCEIPSKATFKVCANFETVRVYDENGLDQSKNGFNGINEYGFITSPNFVSARPSLNDMSYYSGGDNKNISWNHTKGEHCFTRVIDPSKYTSYK